MQTVAPVGAPALLTPMETGPTWTVGALTQVVPPLLVTVGGLTTGGAGRVPTGETTGRLGMVDPEPMVAGRGREGMTGGTAPVEPVGGATLAATADRADDEGEGEGAEFLSDGAAALGAAL